MNQDEIRIAIHTLVVKHFGQQWSLWAHYPGRYMIKFTCSKEVNELPIEQVTELKIELSEKHNLIVEQIWLIADEEKFTRVLIHYTLK